MKAERKVVSSGPVTLHRLVEWEISRKTCFSIEDVWYEHSINGLLGKIGLVAVNIINKLKDKTTRCFSIPSNYIWRCVQYCSLDIGGEYFKAAVPTPLKIPSCPLKQVSSL